MSEQVYDEVEKWRTRKLLISLRDSKGNGTSMISLIIPPKEQLPKVQRMLTDEYGTATNIKSRVNRLSVLAAITSAQQKLKMYNKVPDNGLAIFVGTILEQNKDKKISLGNNAYQKPINTSFYLCVILNFMLEKRYNYVKKISELCTALYISNDKVNVEGLILTGYTDFKNELKEILDQRLKRRVLLKKLIVYENLDLEYESQSFIDYIAENYRDYNCELAFVGDKSPEGSQFVEGFGGIGVYFKI
ncbi:hypothetical protein NQ315_003470 [Exocentrus adspersus]|uniref:Eukaryotic peptide chain release factor subunit 1 n=1 Tax=Exocentrus adspersus TaxID=1586481 RepID=A0AAV8VAH1_9CUCU|nr:hypothetical protein NQ315_003470 [Exocentrus adspersus]